MNGRERWLEWDRWINSDEGRKAADPGTLGATLAMRTYLMNRLANAFFAGVTAEEDAERRRSA
jgi:hypothetical protein